MHCMVSGCSALVSRSHDRG
ncbi:rCG23238 [Rattus norvegicus]|uniref:RCG23238 n=1 Tax=Rattus norvegicus TaxID=10116 RepID=A6JPX7_RAT|nr:rCG23238 [Rattus norvegicus]